MKRWELFTTSFGLGITGSVTDIWTKKDKKTGRTKWDTLQDLASSGWELIDVTSVTYGGNTSEILYTFKRPID